MLRSILAWQLKPCLGWYFSAHWMFFTSVSQSFVVTELETKYIRSLLYFWWRCHGVMWHILGQHRLLLFYHRSRWPLLGSAGLKKVTKKDIESLHSEWTLCGLLWFLVFLGMKLKNKRHMSRIHGIIRLSKEFLKRNYVNISDIFEPIQHAVRCNRQTMTIR